MTISSTGSSITADDETGRDERYDRELEPRRPSQQQQTPWRITLPQAKVPWIEPELAGMRKGEWI